MSDLSHRELAVKLRSFTPARVGLGRTGVSQQTRDLLDFQLAHARARDAVHARLNAAAFAVELAASTSLPVLRVHSAAGDRSTYLQRPDLGRRLNQASRASLPAGDYDLALVVADGLSAIAVERHVCPLLKELLPQLEGWRLAPLVVVELGRVAVADEIGDALGARMSVVFIGERPASPTSG